MDTPAKLIVIGIDSGDRDLIAQWAGEGYLPAFAKLAGASMSAAVSNPHGMEAGSVWPTFHTGVSPARHGQYEGLRIFDPKIYNHRNLRADEVSPHYFWRHLARHNKRMCLIDPTFMRMPAEKINGTIIVDWGVHAPSDSGTTLHMQTQPPELAAEILEKYGPDPLGGEMCDVHKPRTLEKLGWFRDGLVERARLRGEMAADQLAKGGWDYFEVNFSEPHCAGHHCWHLHDTTHPDHDAEMAAALGGNPLRDVYVAADRAVGRLMEVAGPEATVIVYCSHGIGAEYSGTRMLDRMLVALEGRKPYNFRNPALDIARKAWRSMPMSMRRGLKPMQRKAWNKMMSDGFQPDRQNRRYFEVYLNNRSAGIRINLKGREPNGMVEPGAEYDALVDQLMADMLAFTNLESGEPLVEECVPLCRTFEGERLDTLPDISVTWNTRHPIRRITSPKSGDVVNEELTVRNGDHRPVGQFFAVGPNIEPRKLNQSVEAVDFVSTFCLLLDIPIPDTDGKPIEALIGASGVAAE